MNSLLHSAELDTCGHVGDPRTQSAHGLSAWEMADKRRAVSGEKPRDGIAKEDLTKSPKTDDGVEMRDAGGS